MTAADAADVTPNDRFRQTLISASQNIRIDTWETTHTQVSPDCPVPWSVRKLVLHGGKQEGVDLIVLDNGRLQITIVPTRGMGILSVTAGDVRLGWDSPIRQVVHPSLINLHTRGGLGWLEGFNEWLCRCGLEYAGEPGPDTFTNNTGDSSTMELTLHGRIANTPAHEVELWVDRKPPYRICLRGRVDERVFLGPKLELISEISTEPGSCAFRIADTVTNCGQTDQEFQLIYHNNYGRGLLEAGATFVAPLRRVTPFNAIAARNIEWYAEYTGPQPGFIEQTYCLRPLAAEDDRTLLMLRNKAGTQAVSLTYSVKELPCLTLWKNTAGENEGYVTGIEPGTSYPNHRRIERQAGRVPRLAPGECHRTCLDFEVLTDPEQVRNTEVRIKALGAGRKPILDSKPMP